MRTVKNKQFIHDIVKSKVKGYYKYRPLPCVVGVDLTQDQANAFKFFFEDEGKQQSNREFFYAIGGARRSGKTELMSRVILKTEELHPIGDFFLGAMDLKKVKSLYWERIMQLSNKYGYGFYEERTNDAIRTPCGNRIYFRSIRDKAVVEWARGEKFKLALIDEAQTAAEDNLRNLIENSVGPAMSDFGGKIVMAGTSPYIHKGMWYEWRSGKPGIKVYVLDYKKNTFLEPGIREAYLDKIRLRRGLKKGFEDVRFKNEYFDAMLEDKESLVFRYEKEVNHYEKIDIPENERNYVVGYDIGFDDADAICVLCYSHHDSRVYLVEENVGTKQTLEEPTRALKDIARRYNTPPIIVDTGGLGKKIGQELLHRYELNVYPAEKSEKGGWLHTMRDSLHRGDLKIKDTSHAVSEMRLSQWNDKQDNFDPKGYHPDLLDALLYSYRNIHNYLKLSRPTRPAEQSIKERKIIEMAKKKKDNFGPPVDTHYDTHYNEKYGGYLA